MFSVKLGLQKLGSGLCMARKRRRIRQELMAERIGVTRATLKRMEQGLPTVSMGTHAAALFVLCPKGSRSSLRFFPRRTMCRASRSWTGTSPGESAAHPRRRPIERPPAARSSIEASCPAARSGIVSAGAWMHFRVLLRTSLFGIGPGLHSGRTAASRTDQKNCKRGVYRVLPTVPLRRFQDLQNLRMLNR
ncbi:MAG: helix-turn-helix transcriptional regulator [Duodenibacillus sp.]|nr:helix-turn-helix transcriptional regulator [Duodenibacillus sp.]